MPPGATRHLEVFIKQLMDFSGYALGDIVGGMVFIFKYLTKLLNRKSKYLKIEIKRISPEARPLRCDPVFKILI